MGVKTKSIVMFHDKLQPIQEWFATAKVMIKEYYKQIYVKHSQLSLLDSQITTKTIQKLGLDNFSKRDGIKAGKKTETNYECINELIR